MDNTFEEYIRQGEPDKSQRAENWQIAIGLQDVDGLKPSAYLLETAQKHIEGELTMEDVKQCINDYYQTQDGRALLAERTDEADKVSANIADLLAEQTFSLAPTEYARIHCRVFAGVFPHAGEYRSYNITKNEWVLDGDTVTYAPYEMLQETVEFDFSQEKQFSYKGLSQQESIAHVCKFIAGLWQIHPFAEGNTRTTAVFTIKYLKKFGFSVNNDAFKQHAWYFRNALVRANYNNLQKGIAETTLYLERFFENLLFGGTYELKNRHCHIRWSEGDGQSANGSDSKSKICTLNCTLEETAVLNFLKETPEATQKQIAEAIGKSERTVKTITVSLQQKGKLARNNGKRNGTWQVIDNE